MDRFADIQHALRQISATDRTVIVEWLQNLVDAESGALGIAEPSPNHALAFPSYMTIDEYFEFEEASPRHHEYVNGVVYAMSAPSVAHAAIISRLSFVLMSHLHVLIDQDEHRLIIQCRVESWKPRVYVGPQAVAEFRSILLAVPLAQIYAGTLQEP